MIRNATCLPYYLYVPPDCHPGDPLPLIIMLHGCAQTAEEFASSTHMNKLAEQYRFLVAYPQQSSRQNSALCWNWFIPANQVRESGEPALLAGIVRDIAEQKAAWSVDTRRIYVAGLSAGGAMATILGATYPDLFAAVGVHSGLAYQAATSMLAGLRAMYRGSKGDPLQQGQAAYLAMGKQESVMPVIVFHGTSDRQVSLANGERTVQQWMHTNHLASRGTYAATFQHPSHKIIGQVSGGRAYTVYTWSDAHGREIQAYWQVNGMGHGWSGGNPGSGYADETGPDASLAMYHFFMKHVRSTRKGVEHAIQSRLHSIGEHMLKLFHAPLSEQPSEDR